MANRSENLKILRDGTHVGTLHVEQRAHSQ